MRIKKSTTLPLMVSMFLCSCVSTINNIPSVNNSDDVKIVGFNQSLNTIGTLKEGPNTTGVLKEGPNTTGVLKEGPNTTGVLKEGPNTTGVLKEGPNTTGSLKLYEKSILLTNLGTTYNIPVTPEKIKDIDFVYLNNKVNIKSEEIKLTQNKFSIKDNNIYITQPSVEYDGISRFKFKFTSIDDNAIFKFNLIDGTNIYLPMIKGESNINSVITKTDNFVTVNSESSDKSIVSVFKSDLQGNQYFNLIDKNNNNEFYNISNLSEKLVLGQKENLINSEKISVEEKNKIVEKIKDISPLSTFLGAWEYNLLKYKIQMNIADLDNNRFQWAIKIGSRLYQGESNYIGDNQTLFVNTTLKGQTIKLKIESVESNKITVTIDEDDSSDLFILNGISIKMSRSTS